MKNWKLILGMFVIFFLGVVTGVLGVRIVAKTAMSRIVDGGPEAVNRLVMRRLTWSLKLTAEQQEKISAIVRDTQKNLGDIRREAQPKVAWELGTAAMKIRAFLDEEQARKFDKKVAEGRERLERFEKTRGDGELKAVVPAP